MQLHVIQNIVWKYVGLRPEIIFWFLALYVCHTLCREIDHFFKVLVLNAKCAEEEKCRYIEPMVCRSKQHVYRPGKKEL